MTLEGARAPGRRIGAVISISCVAVLDMCLYDCTKGKKEKIGTVSMCQKRARALRNLLARYRNPHLQRLTIKLQKSFCQNLIMGQSYKLCKSFLPAFPILDFPNMAVS